MSSLVVTGTDTGVGKTVVSAGLVQVLAADYWKPVQAGLQETTDSAWVSKLTGARIIPECYRLNLPASPHLAAEDEAMEIDPDRLAMPQTNRTLVIEGAGGVLVPLNRQTFFLDVFTRWQAPVLIVARTALGTINHTALTVRALRAAGANVLGVIFNGGAEDKVEQTICQMCAVQHLGRLPELTPLNSITLAKAFGAIDTDYIRATL
ncbi:dethiobiotin synthase [Roseibium sp. RKSG952]|uniref:dethiobiotin synthase n=1 Tax=Roseibium sp. RKSG952 TaxID=2529384 RepID=UPI0012BCE4E8|nr:dethiobiotin synthase [Roseibium sp. RKSG952]MTH95234.1 ATP-dependent dethiobiotin synthetase BioD [Roseibium sp. RKSG952]